MQKQLKFVLYFTKNMKGNKPPEDEAVNALSGLYGQKMLIII